MTATPSLAEQAGAAFNRRDWPQARELARGALARQPQAGMHYVAGIACLELGQRFDAVEHLRRAVAMAPDRADFGAQLARALSLARHGHEAVQAADRTLALGPSDPLTLDTLGVVYTQAGAHHKAAAAFRLAAERQPERAHFQFNLATALVSLGDIDAAEQALEACLAREPTHWRAHLTLAQLRRQTPGANHLARLEALRPRAEADPLGRMSINLALAKEYEDLGRFAEAFSCLTRGKAAGRALRPYAIERDTALFEALMQAFPAPDTAAPAGCPSTEPLFVIGMPRSGTTLAERILSSHPDVHAAGELPNFGLVLKQLSGSRTPVLLDPDTVARGRRVDARRLGEAYLASTRPGTSGKPRFVDKLPHNFLYAGFIARALPNARIVCLRRHPLDTCLGNFRQLFSMASPNFDYSFDLLDIGRYYVLFDRLIAHWDRVLPGRILQLDYEQLVVDQERASRRLLDFCGLDWHADCLRFERNAQPVATASAVQVRSPIYRGALDRWRHYQVQLGPLRELLGRAGIAVPD
jgi:tetratricopeptide (TPR) repeat protein